MSQLNFDLDYENVGMILGEDLAVEDAATEMMRRNPEQVARWLKGVTTREGEPALPVIEAILKGQ